MPDQATLCGSVQGQARNPRRRKLERTSTQPRTMRHAVVPRWLGGILELDCT